MELTEEFLNQYDLTIQKVELLRHNENMTYRVTAMEGEYVLRIHRTVEAMNLSLLQGNMCATDLVNGEMKLLEFLHEQDVLGTQTPIKNKAGCYVTKAGEYEATLLSWVEGECLQKTQMDVIVGRKIGQMLANLHNSLADYQDSAETVGRYSYGTDLVERLAEFCRATWKQSDIVNSTQQEIICEMLDKIREMLVDSNSDMILVHNDLGESNLLVSRNGIVPIDFSMSGYCIREMDLASLYLHFESVELREAILKGYQEVVADSISAEKIDICIGYQLLIFICSQFQVIQSQGWFAEALEYWCEEIFYKILQGERIQGEIGLYS